MAKFQYAIQGEGGLSKPFEAADEKAAQAMLGSFADAAPHSGVISYTDPSPVPAPTPTPPPQIQSSNSALDDRNMGDARSGAGSTLTGSGFDSTGLTNNILDLERQSISTLGRSSDRLLNAQQLSYNASLGSTNLKYKQMHDQLTQDYQRAMGVAEQNAQSLNPYSEARGASTALNFGNRITGDYHTAAANLEAQADAARQALEAGNYDAYVKIQDSLEQGVQQVRQNTQSMLLDITKQAEQTRQYEQSYDLTKSERAQDDFMSYLTNISGSTELQTDIDNYQSTGEVTPGLAPLIERGRAAGMSADETLSVFQYQTEKVRAAQAAADKLTNAQIGLANTQAVMAAQQNMSAQGILPGTVEYAAGLAAATSGSIKALPISEVQNYTNLGTLAGQFADMKGLIQGVNQGSALGNFAFSRAPVDVQSYVNNNRAQLNAEITSLSGIAGKSLFGESGNLSDSDIKRVLSGLPRGGTSTELRNALYNNLVGLLSDKAVSMLQNDAAAGYQVATYAPIVQSLVDQANGSKVGGSSGADSFDSWFNNYIGGGGKTSFNMVGNTTASSVQIPASSRLSYVNNNPGNLRFVGQHGATQGEGGFARFKSAVAGFEALVGQVRTDAARGLTLAGFVNKFAPPSENNTVQYIQQLASRLGVGAGTAIAKIDPVRLAKEIAKKESSATIA